MIHDSGNYMYFTQKSRQFKSLPAHNKPNSAGTSVYPQWPPLDATTGVESSDSLFEQEIGKLFLPPLLRLKERPEFQQTQERLPVVVPQYADFNQVMMPVTFTSPDASSLSQASKQRKNTLIIVLAVACLSALLGALGFTIWHHFVPTVPDVTLYQVSVQNINQDIGGGGILYPNQRQDISYPVSARVTAVLVKPGQEVSPNQSLLSLDLSQLNAQSIAQLNAQAAQAYQDMLAAQSYLSSVLVTGNSVIIAQAKQQYSAAQNKYNALATETGNVSLHQGNIVSAIRGTVTAVNVYSGGVYPANKVMITIFDESTVIVHAEIPLSDLGQVHLNQTATVTPSVLPTLNVHGTVTSIIPRSDPQTDTFVIWVNVANLNGVLLPGMSVFVRLQNSVQTLAVPRLAVLNPDRESIVFVVRNSHAYIQHVQISGNSGDSLLIKSGLSASDMIVLVGIQSLQDGQEVNITGIEGQTH